MLPWHWHSQFAFYTENENEQLKRESLLFTKYYLQVSLHFVRDIRANYKDWVLFTRELSSSHKFVRFCSMNGTIQMKSQRRLKLKKLYYSVVGWQHSHVLKSKLQAGCNRMWQLNQVVVRESDEVKRLTDVYECTHDRNANTWVHARVCCFRCARFNRRKKWERAENRKEKSAKKYESIEWPINSFNSFTQAVTVTAKFKTKRKRGGRRSNRVFVLIKSQNKMKHDKNKWKLLWKKRKTTGRT